MSVPREGVYVVVQWRGYLLRRIGVGWGSNHIRRKVFNIGGKGSEYWGGGVKGVANLSLTVN